MKPRFIVIPLDGLSRDEMDSLLRMCPTSADRTELALDLVKRVIEDELEDNSSNCTMRGNDTGVVQEVRNQGA